MSSHFCSDRSWCFFRRPVDISSCFAISRRHADICGEILFTRKSDHLDPWSWQRNKSAKPKYDVFLNRTKCFFVAKLQHKETFSAETYSANSKAVTWATGLVSNHNNSVETQPSFAETYIVNMYSGDWVGDWEVTFSFSGDSFKGPVKEQYTKLKCPLDAFTNGRKIKISTSYTADLW